MQIYSTEQVWHGDRPSEPLRAAFFLWNNTPVRTTSGSLPACLWHQCISFNISTTFKLPPSSATALKGITSSVAAARSWTVGQRWNRGKKELKIHTMHAILGCDKLLSEAYLHPFVVVVYYCGNLGLLQHDFWNPHWEKRENCQRPLKLHDFFSSKKNVFLPA